MDIPPRRIELLEVLSAEVKYSSRKIAFKTARDGEKKHDMFLFGGVVVHCAGSLIRVENISNKEFHIIQTLVLVLTLWNCVLH